MGKLAPFFYLAWFRFFNCSGGNGRPHQLLLDAIGVPLGAVEDWVQNIQRE